MHNKFRNIGLIFIGVIAGVLISLNFQAVADRATRTVLPIEELRAFTEVFGAIKANYVEPVEDKKLITEAINGMLTGLDPHSAYLDQEAFKELQVGTQRSEEHTSELQSQSNLVCRLLLEKKKNKEQTDAL